MTWEAWKMRKTWKTRRTWTEHKLTENMLRQLSAIHGGRDGSGRGAAIGRTGLHNRGLIAMGGPQRHEWRTTTEGDAALDQARREGW